ncbi:MAG TPA: TonB-dependent receptor [Candidatus Sulfotelmatobacter sp.]|nr:TonB-dependent receptor [Candidatus Sulfotelmatobacter sp.]
MHGKIMDFMQLTQSWRARRRSRKSAGPWLTGLIICWTLGTCWAHAVDPPLDDLTDLSLEELKKVQVYSASMYLQDTRRAPSSITIVTADEIRKCGYRTLADILRSVRGFYVTYDRNYSYVGLRGFSRPGDYNTRILLLLDGHRLNDNLYNSALIGSEFQLDVDLIERVEIVRGPSSSLYGASAFFAVVNVISKKVQHFHGLELSAAADGFGTYSGRSTYGQQVRGLEMFLSGTLYSSAGPSRLYFPAFNSPLTHSGYAFNQDQDYSQSYFARVSLGHFTLESAGSSRDKQIPTASFNTVFGEPRTHTVDDRGYLELRYERLLQESTEVAASVSFDRVTYHGVYADPAQTGVVLNEDFGRGDWTECNAKLTKSFAQKHKLTLGGDFRNNLRQDQSNYDLVPYRAFLNDRRDSNEWALFAQDEFSITRRLALTAGLRHDLYDTFGGTTNPRLALIYSPLPSTTFKALYGRAFRPPNYYEMYYSDGVTLEANPNLRPETIVTAELAWEQDLGNRFRLTTDGFENRINDLINQQTDSRNGFLVYENAEKVSSRGVELELAGRIAKRIEGRASYSIQKTEDSATGISLTNSPTHLAKAQLTCPFAHHRLFVGSDLQYMSSRTTSTGTVTRPFVIASLTATSREFAGGFELSAGVYNLFNRVYSDPVGAEIRASSLPQNGRDFRIKLTRVFHFK